MRWGCEISKSGGNNISICFNQNQTVKQVVCNQGHDTLGINRFCHVLLGAFQTAIFEAVIQGKLLCLKCHYCHRMALRWETRKRSQTGIPQGGQFDNSLAATCNTIFQNSAKICKDYGRFSGKRTLALRAPSLRPCLNNSPRQLCKGIRTTSVLRLPKRCDTESS